MGAIVSIWAEIGDWAIVAEGCVVKLKQVIPRSPGSDHAIILYSNGILPIILILKP
jgi:hypothetical protein